MSESQTLSGVHVNLRPLAVDDAELTLRWRTSDRALHLHPGATTVAEQARWIATRPAAERNFVIERRDGRPVGMVSLTDIDTVNRHGMPGRFLIGDEAAVKGFRPRRKRSASSSRWLSTRSACTGSTARSRPTTC